MCAMCTSVHAVNKVLDVWSVQHGHRSTYSHAILYASASNVFYTFAVQQCTDALTRQGGDAGLTRVSVFCAAPKSAAMTAACASWSAKMMCLLWGSLMR